MTNTLKAKDRCYGLWIFYVLMLYVIKLGSIKPECTFITVLNKLSSLRQFVAVDIKVSYICKKVHVLTRSRSLCMSGFVHRPAYAPRDSGSWLWHPRWSSNRRWLCWEVCRGCRMLRVLWTHNSFISAIISPNKNNRISCYASYQSQLSFNLRANWRLYKPRFRSNFQVTNRQRCFSLLGS